MYIKIIFIRIIHLSLLTQSLGEMSSWFGIQGSPQFGLLGTHKMSNSNSVCCFCSWEFVWTAWLLCLWQVVPFFPGRQNLCRHSLEVSSRMGGVGFELTNWRFDQKSSAIFSIHSIHLVIAWLLICWGERPSTTSLLCRFAKQECWQAQSSIQFERCWDFLSTWTHILW